MNSPEKFKQEEVSGENTENLKKQLAEKERKIRELKELVEKLKSDLIHDPLTGLKTRRYFIEEIKGNISAIAECESEKRKEGFSHISLLFCDIDYFKKINDTYGHNFGDEILKDVSRILKEKVRSVDIVCRWGGEEMAIGLMGADEKDALEKADELRTAVEEEIIQKYGSDPKRSGLRVSLSIGVAGSEPGLDFEQLIERGDQAMYLAKKDGRNCVRAFSQFEERKTEKKKGGGD